MGPERLVQIKKWNCQNKILVPSKSGPQKYSWKSAKVARKLRERRAKAEVPNQRPLPHELTSNKYNFPFYVLYEVSIAVWVPELVHEGEQGQTTSVFNKIRSENSRKLEYRSPNVEESSWRKIMWLEWNAQGFLLLKHGDVLLYICFHGIPRESSRKQLCCDCCSRKLKLKSRKVRERS